MRAGKPPSAKKKTLTTATAVKTFTVKRVTTKKRAAKATSAKKRHTKKTLVGYNKLKILQIKRLPNEITWTNMECAFIRRYAKCLTSTKAYAEKYGSPSDKKKVSRAANALLKHVEGIIDLPY